MIDQLLILITAVLFYCIGYFVGRYEYVKEKVFRFVELGKKMGKRRKGTLINYITPEQSVYNDSYEKKVDEAREKVFKEQFK